MKNNEALRYNESKVRHDLFEPFAINEVAKVFTKGAEKYAEHNWLKGMAWSKMIASAKRHINAIEKGEDYDFDPNCIECKKGICKNHTGLLHSAHAAWNLLGLTSYYKLYPQGDDRLINILPKHRYGLDIDDVIADFQGHWCAYHKSDLPTYWNFDRWIADKFNKLKDNKDFWMSIPPKIDPSNLPFEPVCYITSRLIPVKWTEEWLDKYKFPCSKVYSIGLNMSKVEAAKDAKVDIFIDDRYDNYLELNKAGICCFLMDCSHNQNYNVGYRRIKSLWDLM